MRLYLIYILITLGSFAFAQEAYILDKVVAQVGSEVILWSDIEEYYAYQKANYGKVPEDGRCKILDNLMMKSLLVSEAKLDTLVIVSDAEVDESLNRRIDEILFMMNGDVEFFREYYGKTVNEVKSDMRDDLQDQLLSDRMQGKIMRDIKITPAEVKEFFNNIPRDSLPYFQSEVEISEIVVYPEVNEEEKDKSIARLEAILKEYEEGKDFGLLAKKYSEDPGSARQNGDLGWQKRGSFVQEFEEAAYKLDINEVSPIVESDFGFHVIQMLDRRGNNFKTRHILIKPEITQTDIDLAKQKLVDVKEEIESGQLSFQDAVSKYSDERSQSKNNAGRLVNPKTSNTFFEIADLDYDVFFAVDSMKVGQISNPVEFVSEDDGEVFFKIIKLDSRSLPHTANMSQDFSKIKAAAVEEKKARFLDEWVKSKSESTYVEIDDYFMDCEMISKWLENKRFAQEVSP